MKRSGFVLAFLMVLASIGVVSAPANAIGAGALGCVLKVNNPHGSGHVPGTVTW